MTGKALVARNLAILSYLTLLVLLVITTFITDVPAEASSTFHLKILAVKLIPLLLFFKGVITSNPRIHQWLCFVVLLYFTQYSMQAYLTEWAIWPVITTLVTMSVFTCSMMFVHWSKPQAVKPE